MNRAKLVRTALAALTLAGLAASAPKADGQPLWEPPTAGALEEADRGEQAAEGPTQPAADYVRFEGSHIVVELFPEHAGLLKNPERWVKQLDAVYEALADLVGGVPYQGQKITIREVPSFQYGLVSGNPILWNADLVPDALESISSRGDILFGPIHELSHDFDLAGTYIGGGPNNAEHWANLKALYVLDTLARRFPDSVVNINYYDPETYVALGELGTSFFIPDVEPYLASKLRDWRQAPSITGLFYMEAQGIGWEPFKATFRDYLAGSSGRAAASTDEGKINEFIRLLSKSAGRDLSPQFREWGFPTPPVAIAPLAAGWSHACYVGAEESVEGALGDIVGAAEAVYRLGPQQRFDRWFAARPDLSTIATLISYEPLLVLSSEASTWAQLATGTPPTSVSLAQGWNSVCYTGQTKSADDATAGIAGKFAILYRLSDTEVWGRYVPGNPEVSSITQLSQDDAVLILVTQEGGATWVFDP